MFGRLRSLKFNNAFILIQNRGLKDDLPVNWERPKKIPFYKPEKAGDLQEFKDVYDKEFPILYDKSKELQEADDMVKKLFTLEFQTAKVVKDAIKHKFKQPVKRHAMDDSSIDTRIAEMTVTIRRMQRYMDEQTVKPHGVLRNYLNDLIQKRRKHLKNLQRYDYKRFEWLLEKLDLVYIPRPTEPITVTRKPSIRKLTQKLCDDMIKEKTEKYKADLESQQLDFLKDKLKTLEWIQSKEKELNVPETVTESDIDEVKQQIEQIELRDLQKKAEMKEN